MNHQRPLAASAVALLLVVAGCAGALGAAADGAGAAAKADAQQASSTPAWGADSSALRTETARNGTTANLTGAANGTLEVHFVHVGQSSSTLLVAPNGETLLVDTGDWRDDGRHVLQYLRANGVTRIDHLVTSHGDADHVGGHAAVIEYFETEADGVGAVYDSGIASSSETYGRYLDAVEAHGVTLYRVAANDTIPFGGVETRVLAPPPEPLADGQRNENSVVLAVEHGGHEFLFPGDGETEAESYLVERYGAALDATALAAGHHGSRSSSGDAFLDATEPRVVVVSSAYDSQYGHPHEETLRRLANRSVPTYWTGTHGDVVLRSDGRNLSVWTQRNATANATRLRSAPPVEPEADGPVTYRRRLVAANDSEANESVVETPQTGTAVPAATTEPAATPASTPASPSTETDAPAAAGTLSLVEVHADASGDEWDNLNDEYLVFANAGDAPLDLSGWTVRDEADHTYRFPDGVTLDPGASVTLHTGTGTDSATDRYWGSGAPVWNNGGDTVVVTDDEGTVVLRETYS
jgi:competence protein ComEC